MGSIKAKFLMESCLWFRAFVFNRCSFHRLFSQGFGFFYPLCFAEISFQNFRWYLKSFYEYLLRCIFRCLNRIRKIHQLIQVRSTPYFWRLGFILSYALKSPQRSVAHTASVICTQALKVPMQPASCLPDAACSVVCCLLKDGEVVDKDEAVGTVFTLKQWVT